MGVHDPVVETGAQPAALAGQEDRQEVPVEADVVAHQGDGLAVVGEVVVQEDVQHHEGFAGAQGPGVVLLQADAVHGHGLGVHDVVVVLHQDLQLVVHHAPLAHHQPQAEQAVA